MWKSIQRLLVDEGGPTSVEYAVMLALILVVCFASVVLVGNTNTGTWANNATRIRSGIS